MNKSSQRQNILLGILVLAILGIVVLWFTGGSSGTTGGVVANEGVSGNAAYAPDVLGAIELLKRVRLDTGIFTKAEFTRLTDFRISVPTQTLVGRRNPFLPF